MADAVPYFTYTFTNQQKRQVISVVTTSPEDAWTQLGIKLGSMVLRQGFAQSGAPQFMGCYAPGSIVTPRDQQIGQQ